MIAPVSPVSRETEFDYYNPEQHTNDVESDSDSDSESGSSKNEDATEIYSESVKQTLDRVLQSSFPEGHPLPEQDLRSLTRDKVDQERTALQLLAIDKREPSKDLEWLVRQLLTRRQDLLSAFDHAGYTAIHDAIRSNQASLVQYMCDAHPNIDTILSMRNCNKQNCVHFAIENNLDLNVTSKLVRSASAGTLRAKDNKGNTPLHLAVDFARCRPNQICLVRLITTEADAKMEQSIDAEVSEDVVEEFNGDKLSPYQVWQTSLHVAQSNAKKVEEDRRKRREKKERERMEKEKARERESGSAQGGLSKEGHGKGGRSVTRPISKPQPSAPPGPSQDSSTRPEASGGNKFGAASVPKVSKDAGMPKKVPNIPIALSPSTNVAGKDVTLQTKQTKSKKSETRRAEKNEENFRSQEAHAQEIGQFLKTYYLQTRSPNAALEILYGKDATTNKQLYFDLWPYTSIALKRLKTVLKAAEFDEMLKYVALPDIRLDDESKGSSADSTYGKIPTRKQSSAVEQVFSWLSQKGVKLILEIVVHDESNPHGDENIEKALKPFGGILLWDWKKLDLCSEVVAASAPDVEILHLYWGGNNAVLRSWSELDGISKLKNLQEVHVHVQKYSGTFERTKANLDDFETRLRKRRESIEIIRYGFGDANSRRIKITKATNEVTHQPIQHEWIKSMDSFKQLLLDAVTNVPDQEGGVKDWESRMLPVKVALIDDGINLNELDYTPAAGYSYSSRDRMRQYAWHHSSSGHGTVMASQIYRICPRAKLYVFKLDDRPGRDRGPRITAKSAAQAIQAAVNKKVDIISMSWTIKPRNDAERTQLNTAIANATAQGILMFCAADDTGPMDDNSYPYEAAKDVAFRIGAADASGHIHSKVAGSDRIHFIFPGNDVMLEQGASSLQQPEIYRSGSSVATALAAGLAALVLYCVQFSKVQLEGRNKTEDVARLEEASKKLRSHKHMREVFRSMGTTDESKNKYITVWSMFGNEAENKDRHISDKIKHLTTLGQTLAHRGTWQARGGL